MLIELPLQIPLKSAGNASELWLTLVQSCEQETTVLSERNKKE